MQSTRLECVAGSPFRSGNDAVCRIRGSREGSVRGWFWRSTGVSSRRKLETCGNSILDRRRGECVCVSAKKPGVFTRVEHYVDWIKKHVDDRMYTTLSCSSLFVEVDLLLRSRQARCQKLNKEDAIPSPSLPFFSVLSPSFLLPLPSTLPSPPLPPVPPMAARRSGRALKLPPAGPTIACIAYAQFAQLCLMKYIYYSTPDSNFLNFISQKLCCVFCWNLYSWRQINKNYLRQMIWLGFAELCSIYVDFNFGVSSWDIVCIGYVYVC